MGFCLVFSERLADQLAASLTHRGLMPMECPRFLVMSAFPLIILQPSEVKNMYIVLHLHPTLLHLKPTRGARELTEQLQVQAALVENQSSVPALTAHNLQLQLLIGQYPPLASMGTCTLCIYSSTTHN